MPLKSRILRALAAGTLIYRVFWAFSIQTTFVPDEYYQTVEPVNIIFYGASNIGLNSTWEWRDEFRIRSFVPLLPFMLLYQIKFLIGSSLSVLMNEVVVLKGPRLVSAVISSYSDFLFYAILKKFTGSDYLAVFITCIHLFSWSASYCLSRTLANSTETAFLIIGLHFWLLESSGKTCNNEPIQAAATTTLNCSSSESADQTSIRNRTRKRSSSKGKNEFRQREHTSSAMFAEHPEKKTNSKMSSNSCCVPSLAVALIVMTVHCRPTAVLFWAPLILIRSFQKISPWRYIIFHCVPTGVAVLLLCVAVDSICYGRFTVTPFNFFYINITRNYAALFYGVKSWHWNFTHGLPVMLGLYTPFLVPSIVLTPQPEEAIILVIVSLTYVLLLRCVTAHQEYRFLLPVLPFLHIAIGFTLWDLAVWCLPGLGKPPRQPHTVLSYCLSMIGLTSHIRDTALKIGELSESDAYRYSRGDDAKGSVALGGSSIKQNQETTKENGKVVKQAVMPSVGRILCLLLLFLVVIAHLAVAFYLSTRHQVRHYQFSSQFI